MVKKTDGANIDTEIDIPAVLASVCEVSQRKTAVHIKHMLHLVLKIMSISNQWYIEKLQGGGD